MKKLSFKDAFFMVAGTAIGSGVIVLAGVGISRTGVGASLAYLVAGILIAFALSPMIVLGSVAPRNGGSYTYIKELLNPYWGAMFLVIFTIAKVGVAMFCISLAQYFMNGVIGIEADRIYLRIFAFVIVTLFYVLNLLGQRTTVKAQNAMTFVLFIALIVFAVVGLFKVDYTGAFTSASMFPKGSSGFISAVSILVFGVIGGIGAVDYGTNIENASKNIPRIVLLIMLGTAVLNAVIALVASLAAPLTAPVSHLLTAAQAMGGPVFAAGFVLCGAVLALATTINGNFVWFSAVVSRGVDDGLLPKAMGKTNKNGIKYVLCTIIYVMSIIVLLLDMETVLLANMATGLSLLFTIIPNIGLIFAPTKYAEEWNKSKFPIKNRAVITIWALLSTAVAAYLVFNTIKGYTTPTLIVVGCVFALGFIYSAFVGSKLKKETVNG